MAQISSYGWKAVTAVLDGQNCSGFWEGDDAVVVSERDDVGTEIVGVDGSFIFSQNISNSKTITVRLMHTSPTHRLLIQKMKRQQAQAGGKGFPFSVQDRTSGEGGATTAAFIKMAPDDQKGRNASTRVWTLVCGDWETNDPNAS
ncbi:phage structural protein [Aurantimonas coralicida]|uniref:phage structural protein n=1 Tax=Aurantimonas coralicida TaxID=182270 RepID=UPI001E482FD0|nr:phage protein [Aurantimonas coralicida]MCD1645248.1 DUF3277 family protein [Aurantimonas coralicida]